MVDEACSRYGGEERSKQGFDEKAEGKRPLGRSRRRWENNIKQDLQVVRWWARNGLFWLRLGTVGGICESGSESLGSTKCREFLD